MPRPRERPRTGRTVSGVREALSMRHPVAAFARDDTDSRCAVIGTHNAIRACRARGDRGPHPLSLPALQQCTGIAGTLGRYQDQLSKLQPALADSALFCCIATGPRGAARCATVTADCPRANRRYADAAGVAAIARSRSHTDAGRCPAACGTDAGRELPGMRRRCEPPRPRADVSGLRVDLLLGRLLSRASLPCASVAPLTRDARSRRTIIGVLP